MNALTVDRVEPWSPWAAARPVLGREGSGLVVEANGTRSCAGGWQLHYAGVEPGTTYAVEVTVRHEQIEQADEALVCRAYWADLPDDQALPQPYPAWDALVPERLADDTVRFSRVVVAPPDAGRLCLRYTLRWSATGRSVWSLPLIGPEPVASSSPRRIRVGVVTGAFGTFERAGRRVEANVDAYVRWCERAADGTDLLVLPEIALQRDIDGSPFDLARPVPGPETDAFARIARRHRTRILVGMLERDGDAVYNSAVLIGPTGAVEGIHRKVHLAADGEDQSGIRPGTQIPVFDTDIGRIGCNICMDGAIVEASRTLAQRRADLMLLPTMGDIRADRWSIGEPVFHEDRWKAIMRTRAMDTSAVLVVARNDGLGSCVIDRKGVILAWNEGDDDVIFADVDLDDSRRGWSGALMRDIQRIQARPHVYQGGPA